jgi:hypothetical protein
VARIGALLLGLLLVAHHGVMGWGYDGLGLRYQNWWVATLRDLGLPDDWVARVLYGGLPTAAGVLLIAGAIFLRRKKR